MDDLSRDLKCYIRNIPGIRQYADDLCQETLLYIHNNRLEVKTWKDMKQCFKSVRNEFTRNMTKEKKAQEEALLNELSDSSNTSPLYALSRTLIKNMKDPYGKALKLYYLDGKDGKAISKGLNVPYKNVFVILQRGRKTLKKLLKEIMEFSNESR